MLYCVRTSCTRNVHRRNRALTAFKAEDLRVRVIMLGLENAASGSNLMEATHVLLLGTLTFRLNYNPRSIRTNLIPNAETVPNPNPNPNRNVTLTLTVTLTRTQTVTL